MFIILNEFSGTVYGTAASLDMAIAIAELIALSYASWVSVKAPDGKIKFKVKV